MKSTIRISSGLSCLALLACSTAAEAPAGQAGASSSNAGAGPVTGGAGAPAVAGASPGGATGGSGAPGAAGAAGAAVGGTSGASSAVAGAGGSTPTAGAGGGSSVAGAGGGSAMAGASGSAAGGGAAVDTTLTGAFDGALLQFPCGSGNPNYDCAEPSPCSNASASQDAQAIKPSGAAATSWTMGGTPGTMYDVKVHIQGVVEPSWYHDGTRSAGNSTSVDVASTVPGAKPNAKDLFQTGGTRLMFATDNGNGFDYNSYELDVTPAGGGTPSVYFLNSVSKAENPHTSSKTLHLSFEIDEMPTIKIPGGATISLTMRDSNCVLVQNCGTSNNNMCGNGARVVPLTGAEPPAPSSWTGKTTSGTGGNLNGQFVHFDVISVTVAQ